jgi:hypothetical protein
MSKEKEDESHGLPTTIIESHVDIMFIFGIVVFSVVGMMILQFLIIRGNINGFNSHQFPIDTLINALMGFIAIFSGGNTVRSFLKISYLPAEAPTKDGVIPLSKQKQVITFTLISFILLGLSMVLQGLVGESGANFATDACTNLFAACVISFAVMKGTPKIAENVYLTVPEEKEKKPRKKGKDTPEVKE